MPSMAARQLSTCLFILVMILSPLFSFSAQEEGDDPQRAKKVYQQATEHLAKRAFEKAAKKGQQALTLAEEEGDQRIKAESLHFLGKTQHLQGNYDEAVAFYDRALEAWKESDHPLGEAGTRNNLGLIHKAKGELEKATQELIRSLEIREEHGDPGSLGSSYTNLGSLAHRRGRFTQALGYFENALKEQKKAGDSSGMGISHNNIGNIHILKEDFFKAYGHLKSAVELLSQEEARTQLAEAHHNLGLLFLRMTQKEGRLDLPGMEGMNEERALDSASYHQKKNLELLREDRDPESKIHTYLGMGRISKAKKEGQEAIEWYQKAADLAKRKGVRPLYYEAQHYLAEAYAMMGSYKKAYLHEKEFATVGDSVHSEEVMKAIAGIEEKYQSEKRKRRIQLLEKEKEKTWAIIYAVSGGGVVALFLLFLLFNRFRIIRKQKQLIHDQKKEVDRAFEELSETHKKLHTTHSELQDTYENLQEKNQEVRESIDYAALIQDAILPSEDELKKAFELHPVSPEGPNGGPFEHFVFFQPQATVSGDLYWCFRDREQLLWAAIDCTGHGVPGAIMSVMASDLLDEAVGGNGERDPGRILDRMREGVREKLKKSDRRDGMDIGLLSLETRDGRRILRSAGANLPLYLIRKGVVGSDREKQLRGAYGEKRIIPFKNSQDGLIIKGDKQAVGFEEQGNAPFTTIELEVEKGDRLYSFSDGFPDQFGGPRDKKFRYGPFRELLLDIHEQPMEDQKKILEERLEEWKGPNEQVDDVLVIGVEI